MCLVGRSGIGKTTLLRLISGLLAPLEGRVAVAGIVGHSGPKVALVFQDPALLPWRTALENVLLPVELRATNSGVREALSALDSVGLADHAHKFPNELSGGMKTRVAIARALVVGAPVLLLDEPFGNLDEVTRYETYGILREVQQKKHVTILMVTHNIVEALTLARRALVLSRVPACIVRDVTVLSTEWWELRELILQDLRIDNASNGS